MVSVCASLCACACIQGLVCWQVCQGGVLNVRSLEKDEFSDRGGKHRDNVGKRGRKKEKKENR